MSEFGLRSYDEDPVDPALPEHLRAIWSGDWINLIFRMKIPTNCYGVAIALARFASTDGSNVFPGAKKVGDMAKLDEKTARGHIHALERLGMLVMKKRGGGRAGNPSVYRLTRPADITTLPLWLDPDMNRIEAGAEFRAAEPTTSNAYSPALVPGEATEHRASTPGEYGFEAQEHRALAPAESEEHRAPTPDESPVDNPGAAKTPGDPDRNTGRSGLKHRAPTPDDLTITRPLEDLPGSSQATHSPDWRERGPLPTTTAKLVGPPDIESWTPELEQAAAPARVVHAAAVLAPTPALTAALALLAAQPNDGEWYRAAAGRELRAEGLRHPEPIDIAIRAVAILRRTDPETRSA